MAKSLSRVAIVVTVALVLQLCSLMKPVVCTSRKTLHHSHHQKRSLDGFRVELRHVDHGKNLTKLERLQRAVMRANQRVEHLSAATSPMSETSTAIKAQIHPGQGEFLMNLSIGTPPLPYSAIVDTGSDLIWTQCTPCLHCYTQPSPIFSPRNSSSYAALPCNSTLCSALPLPSCSEHRHCTYTYEYGDYSTTSGNLATETLTFSKSVSVSKIAFGCGVENQGGGFDQGGGLVGLGRGPLSLVSQLNEPRFSYCLTMDVGTLLLGSAAVQSGSALTTPLLKNPSQPSFYYVNMHGISVGNVRLHIPKSAFTIKEDGSGGMIVDSGTTITYLDPAAFGPVRREILRRIKLPLADNVTTEDTGLELCFKMPSGSGYASGPRDVDVPGMVFHFEGADLGIPPENYMVGVAAGSPGEPDMLCLAMGSSGGMSVFGNMQQQNVLVLHDLVQQTLSFTPTNCATL